MHRGRRTDRHCLQTRKYLITGCVAKPQAVLVHEHSNVLCKQGMVDVIHKYPLLLACMTQKYKRRIHGRGQCFSV